MSWRWDSLKAIFQRLRIEAKRGRGSRNQTPIKAKVAHRTWSTRKSSYDALRTVGQAVRPIVANTTIAYSPQIISGVASMKVDPSYKNSTLEVVLDVLLVKLFNAQLDDELERRTQPKTIDGGR